MNTTRFWLLSFVISVIPVAAAARDNTLSRDEVRDGWTLLWDGKSSAGWKGAKLEEFPDHGWQMTDGVLSVGEGGGIMGSTGGDIVTIASYSDFELTADFKIPAKGKSAIKYYVGPTSAEEPGAAIGLEYHLVDDVLHPDGKNPKRTLGSLYDLIAASEAKVVNPTGQWNSLRIVSRGAQVEHWLNGSKVAEYDRSTEKFRAAIEQSKYKGVAGFGEVKEGHILLQDHGYPVCFRNLKIRVSRNKN